MQKGYISPRKAGKLKEPKQTSNFLQIPSSGLCERGMHELLVEEMVFTSLHRICYTSGEHREETNKWLWVEENGLR